MAKYDVFVSYRREGGYGTALPIVEKLRSAGYKVFFDLESLNSGKFNEQLNNVIDEAVDFILVLPKNGLDRCGDKEDWVRLEVERALKGNKNIIPVMLAGFEWPEKLPASLLDLPNYQGISASTPEHFEMAIERLKRYLKSKPCKPLKKWSVVGGIFIVSAVVLALVMYLTFLQLAKPVCTKVGTQMSFAMNLIHEMYKINTEFDKSWDLYVEQRQKSSLETQNRLDVNYVKDINERFIPGVEEIITSYPGFEPLTGYEKFLLGLYNVDPADVEGLEFIVNSQGKECIENFRIRQMSIEANMFNTASLKTLRDGIDAGKCGMNVIYYNYLEFMSHLPKDAWVSHRKISSNWHLFPTTNENFSPEEYAQLAEKELKKMEKAIEPMNAFVEMLSNSLNLHEEYLSDIENAISEIEKKDLFALDREAQAAQQRVEEKRENSEQLRGQVDDTEQVLIDQFKSYKIKFAILASDDQYLKWGKVCKAASYLELTVNANAKRAKEGASPTITNADALDYVLQQLDLYQKYHPETAKYVVSAKEFYRDVANGHRKLVGMILVGTKDNVPHPLLQVGDIVVERNGKSGFTTFSDYTLVAKLNNPGTIKYLRLSGSNLRECTAVFPDTDVQIGLLQLKD